MDIGKLISWAVTAGLVFGAYKYLSTGDITIMAPPPETVLRLAKQANRNLDSRQHLATGKPCTRTGGGIIKQGIYSCEIQVFTGLSSYNVPSDANYLITVTKRNGRWQITQ